MREESGPDLLGGTVRFVCGFFVGGAMAMLIAIGVTTEIDGKVWAVAVGGGALFGLLAMRYGDDAWEWLAAFCSGQ